MCACSLFLGEIISWAKGKKKKPRRIQLSHKQLVKEFTDADLQSGLFGYEKDIHIND